jgi:precorrin-2 dehydrogenase/sirohydrochlorin ferrochelatase
MLPIVLTPNIPVGVAGAGEALQRRLALLEAAGVTVQQVTDNFDGLRLLFVAGLDESAARELAQRARRAGVLVNVEDIPQLCDFHMPAQVRRGDLLITISTGGRSPGLARVLREALEESFGAEWDAYLDELAKARARWRAAGLAPQDVAARTRAFLDEKGWLQ